ncbi:MAG: AmmeMemoRadiSam system protein A [Desulfobaccales bacterium]
MKMLRLVVIWLSLGATAFPGLWVPPSWGGQADMNLSTADKQLLLQVARDSIAAQLKGKAATPVQATSPVLEELRGAFVSLHRRGQLRGCIGYIEAIKPLLQTVREMAPAAAFQDPRFRPLQADELADLEIEISVLTPMRLIKSVDEIEVGTHGLYIVRGLNRGLLLPQVATQYHWDRPTFLAQTCNKAGLPGDAWKDPGTQIFIFRAEIFADHSPQ